VHWAITEGSLQAPILIAVEMAEAPASYDEGQALVWYRDRMRFIIDQFKPRVVAIRYPEPIGKSRGTDAAHRRSRVEGVVLEAASSNNLKTITGAFATISKNLGSGSAKKYLEEKELRGLDWSEHSKNQREAILVAASVLPSE
jgi:hypothetical protein